MSSRKLAFSPPRTEVSTTLFLSQPAPLVPILPTHPEASTHNQLLLLLPPPSSVSSIHSARNPLVGTVTVRPFTLSNRLTPGSSSSRYACSRSRFDELWLPLCWCRSRRSIPRPASRVVIHDFIRTCQGFPLDRFRDIILSPTAPCLIPGHSPKLIASVEVESVQLGDFTACARNGSRDILCPKFVRK